ncbi:MAG: T9SS type A sorting domain-containing protein [Bacteroidota bacterium]
MDNTTSFVSPNEYEEPYLNETLEAAQAWACYEELILTPLDGTTAGSFGEAETGQGFWRYPRRIRMPLSIDVPLGTITQESSMELFIRKYAIVDNVITIDQRTIRYFPSIRDPSKYFLEFGVSDQFLDFSYLELRSVNGPCFGVAELRLSNCFDRRTQSEDVVTTVRNHELDIKVFPNPSVDRLYVVFPSMKHSHPSITLTNIQGQVVDHIKAKSVEGQVEIPVAHLSPGLYLLTVDSNGQVKHYPIHIK